MIVQSWFLGKMPSDHWTTGPRSSVILSSRRVIQPSAFPWSATSVRIHSRLGRLFSDFNWYASWLLPYWFENLVIRASVLSATSDTVDTMQLNIVMHSRWALVSQVIHPPSAGQKSGNWGHSQSEGVQLLNVRCNIHTARRILIPDRNPRRLDSFQPVPVGIVFVSYLS